MTSKKGHTNSNEVTPKISNYLDLRDSIALDNSRYESRDLQSVSLDGINVVKPDISFDDVQANLQNYRRKAKRASS